jgi:hypothetical protein
VATTSHDGTNVPTIGGMFVGPAYLAVYSANSSSSEFVTVYETAFGTELAIERGGWRWDGKGRHSKGRQPGKQAATARNAIQRRLRLLEMQAGACPHHHHHTHTRMHTYTRPQVCTPAGTAARLTAPTPPSCRSTRPRPTAPVSRLTARRERRCCATPPPTQT